MDRQIKFTVGNLESLQNTVGILVLNPDQKLMPALLDMGKIIVAFVTSVRRDQRRNRRIQIVNQFDERAVFIALFEFLDQNIRIGMAVQVIEGVDIVKIEAGCSVIMQ